MGADEGYVPLRNIETPISMGMGGSPV